MRERLVAGLLFMWGAAMACGGSGPQPETAVVHHPIDAVQAPAPPVIGIALDVQPGDAEVSIDDVSRGPASKLTGTIPLDPGLHWLIVQLEGYKSYRAEFTVSDKTERFTIRLDRKREK